MTVETRVLFALLLPLLGVLGVLLARRRPNVREAVSLAVGASLFLAVASLVGPITAGADGHVVLARPLPGVALVGHKHAFDAAQGGGQAPEPPTARIKPHTGHNHP